MTKDVVRCKRKGEFRKFNIEKQFISGSNDTGLTNIPGEDQLSGADLGCILTDFLNRPPKAQGRVGGSGGMLPREMF